MSDELSRLADDGCPNVPEIPDPVYLVPDGPSLYRLLVSLLLGAGEFLDDPEEPWIQPWMSDCSSPA